MIPAALQPDYRQHLVLRSEATPCPDESRSSSWQILDPRLHLLEPNCDFG